MDVFVPVSIELDVVAQLLTAIPGHLPQQRLDLNTDGVPVLKMRSIVRLAAVVVGVMVSAPLQAAPITVKIGELAFSPGSTDPDFGFVIPGFPVLHNLTGSLPAPLQHVSFEGVRFWDDVNPTSPVDVGSVSLSAEYQTYAPAAGEFFVSLSFLGSGLGNFSVFLDATTPTDINYTYDDASPAPIPEPGSLTLLGTGLAAFLYGVRRARRRHSVS